jgi:hypothetical protein
MGMKSRIEKEIIYNKKNDGGFDASDAFILFFLFIIGFILVPDSLKMAAFAVGFIFGLCILVFGISNGSFGMVLFGLINQLIFIFLGNSYVFVQKSDNYYLIPIIILIIFLIIYGIDSLFRKPKKKLDDFEDEELLIRNDLIPTEKSNGNLESKEDYQAQYVKTNLDYLQQRIHDDIDFDEKLSMGYQLSPSGPSLSNRKQLLEHMKKTSNLSSLKPIPDTILKKAIHLVNETHEKIPFYHRGIQINENLIRVTMEILNAEPSRTLPQNARNDIVERTPDGLDKRIKLALLTDLRTANIITDVLERAGIVQNVIVTNPYTGRDIKGTKLNENWTW